MDKNQDELNANDLLDGENGINVAGASENHGKFNFAKLCYSVI